MTAFWGKQTNKTNIHTNKQKAVENHWEETAVISQSVVARSLLWLTVVSRCSLGFIFNANHIQFLALSMSLLQFSVVTLILPLLPAHLSSFKWDRNYVLCHFHCFLVYKCYIFACILFFYFFFFSVLVNIRSVNRIGSERKRLYFS